MAKKTENLDILFIFTEDLQFLNSVSINLHVFFKHSLLYVFIEIF